jgi:sugar/nucleoside kinase (ribokinase family)
MYDLITVGSISIDTYYKGNSLTQSKDRFTLAIGGKYLMDHFYSGLGGGAANVAIGVQKQGFKTAVIGKIGNNPFKKMILEHLESHEVSHTMCQYEDDYMKISSILLSPSGERTIIHYETPHEHILETEEDLLKFEKTEILYMSNLWRVPLAEREKILAHVHASGVLTVVNLGIADCKRSTEQIQGLLKNVNILIINTHECAELLKKQFSAIDWHSDITQNVTYLKDKIIVVTDGANGSFSYVDGIVTHVTALKVSKVLDTTGAGDAYSAGFISGYLKTKNVETSMRLGAKLGAHMVQKIGAN